MRMLKEIRREQLEFNAAMRRYHREQNITNPSAPMDSSRYPEGSTERKILEEYNGMLKINIIRNITQGIPLH
jgi:hypothetical protein